MKPSQKYQLLRQFRRAGDVGLTDEQAAENAALTRACYWKRCGELRKDGLIAFTGDKRVGGAFVPRAVSIITPEGVAFMEARAK